MSLEVDFMMIKTGPLIRRGTFLCSGPTMKTLSKRSEALVASMIKISSRSNLNPITIHNIPTPVWSVLIQGLILLLLQAMADETGADLENIVYYKVIFL